MAAIPVTRTYAYCGHMRNEFLANFCVKMSVHWAWILLLHVSKYLRLQNGIIRNTQMPLTKLDRAQIFSESALSFVALFLVSVEMWLYSAPIETNFDHDKCAEFINSTSSEDPRDYDEWESYMNRRGNPLPFSCPFQARKFVSLSCTSSEVVFWVNDKRCTSIRISVIVLIPSAFSAYFIITFWCRNIVSFWKRWCSYVSRLEFPKRSNNELLNSPSKVSARKPYYRETSNNHNFI
jgi:hypothetical protein